MGLGRLQGAVSDLAETLRRLFRDPPVRRSDPSLGVPRSGAVPLLVGVGLQGGMLPEARRLEADLELRAHPHRADLAFPVRLEVESGWQRWAAGAEVLALKPFARSGARRMEVPPLPRRASVRRLEAGGFRLATRSQRPAFRPPALRGGPVGLPAPKVFRDLDLALGLPLGVAGEDFSRLPRALGMRYTLQLVKQTGENIRNLEVLGLYRIPARGVHGLRHDAPTGRLLLTLGPEAAGADRLPLLLARRRTDRALLSCFLETD